VGLMAVLDVSEKKISYPCQHSNPGWSMMKKQISFSIYSTRIFMYVHNYAISSAVSEGSQSARPGIRLSWLRTGSCHSPSLRSFDI
jgi:hypothetical protein